MNGDWEAVFWDIGGVILDLESVQRGHRLFVESLVDEHALESPVEDAVETWRTTVGDYFRARNGTEFRSALTGYGHGVEAVVGEPLDEAEWLPSFHHATIGVLEPHPHAVETIHQLAATDLHVGVVSDVDTDEGHRILEAFGVKDSFDSITTSEEVGRTKPDPVMFQTALEKAGVDPSQSLMIGDRYKHDIEGAAKAGLHTVAYGADDGPAVDYRVDSLDELLTIL